MALNKESIVNSLRDLLPTGVIWKIDRDSLYRKFLKGVATVFYEFMLRKEVILNEIDPRRAVALLKRWEIELGLPDPLMKAPETLKERQVLVYQRLTAKGGQSPLFFKQLIASLGFEASIVEHKKFTAGSRAGERLTNTDQWLFAWRVVLKDGVIFKFRAGSRAGERLRVFRNDLVQFVVERYKPAHTQVIYTFGD